MPEAFSERFPDRPLCCHNITNIFRLLIMRGDTLLMAKRAVHKAGIIISKTRRRHILLSLSDLYFRFLTIVYRSVKSLLMDENDYEAWGYLSLPNGSNSPESLGEYYRPVKSVGCLHGISDAIPPAMLLLFAMSEAYGGYNLGSKATSCSTVRGYRKSAAKTGDIISLGGVELVFIAISKYEQAAESEDRIRPGLSGRYDSTPDSFQIHSLQLCISFDEALPLAIPAAFLALIVLHGFLTRSAPGSVESRRSLLCTLEWAWRHRRLPTCT